MRVLMVFLLLVAGLSAAPTTVRQRLYAPDGRVAVGGKLELEVTQPFTAADGTYVPAQVKTYTISPTGWVTLSVVPNIGSLPASWYNVRLTITGSPTATSIWQVPASTEPLSIPDVTITTGVDLDYIINPRQIALPSGWLMYGGANGAGVGLAPGADGTYLRISGGVPTYTDAAVCPLCLTSDQLYANPAWITSLAATKITGNMVSTITGTANQITASASTGPVTLSIPSNPVLPGVPNITTSNGIKLLTAGSPFTLSTSASTFNAVRDDLGRWAYNLAPGSDSKIDSGEPMFNLTMEAHYYDLTNRFFEFNWNWLSVDGLTSRRPFYMTINRSNNRVYQLFSTSDFKVFQDDGVTPTLQIDSSSTSHKFEFTGGSSQSGDFFQLYNYGQTIKHLSVSSVGKLIILGNPSNSGGNTDLQTNQIATSNTTHKDSPQLSLVGSVWDGSTAQSWKISQYARGVSGTNGAYSWRVASDYYSSLLDIRADTAAAVFAGTVTAPTFIGALTGNASTASALAAIVPTGRIWVANGTGAPTSNANLCADVANTRMGLGTCAPTYAFDLQATSNTVGFRSQSNTAGDILYYATGSVTGDLNVFRAVPSATGNLNHTLSNASTTTGNTYYQAVVPSSSSGDPGFQLTVAGAVDFTLGLDNSSSDQFRMGYMTSPSGAGAAIAISASTSNVMVGTTTDDGSNKLQIAGGLALTGNITGTGGTTTIYNNASGSVFVRGGATQFLSLGANNTNDFMRVLANGNILMGTTTDLGYGAHFAKTGSSGTMLCYDPTATTGTTKCVFQAGAGQVSSIVDIRSAAGSTLSRFVANGGLEILGAGMLVANAGYTLGEIGINTRLEFASGRYMAWSSTTDSNGTKDTSISRFGAAGIQIGDGGANANGTIKANIGLFGGATDDGLSKLIVSGGMNVTDGTSTLRMINSGGQALLGTTGSHPLIFRIANTGVAGLFTTGNWTIGGTTDDGSNKLQVAGSGKFTAAAAGAVQVAISSATIGAWAWRMKASDSTLYLSRDETIDALSLSAAGVWTVQNTLATTGNTKFVVKAGQGQSTNLTEWQSYAGSGLASIDGSGNYLTVAGFIGNDHIRAGAGSVVYWNGRSYMTSPADGVIRFTNAAQTDFSRLQFGGTTSSFPALRRSSAQLDVILADASNWTRIAALGYTFGASNSKISESSDGVLALYDNLSTSFGRLQFGGITSSFPALKRSSAILQARLADDSAYTDVQMNAVIVSKAAPSASTDACTAGQLWAGDMGGTKYTFYCVASGTIVRSAFVSF